MEWIKVKDKMPEEDQLVLVWGLHNHKGEESWRVCIGWRDDDDCYVINPIPYFDNDTMDDVTHWMPLPEKPK